MNSTGKAIAIAFAGATILSVAANADPLMIGYIGDRSPNPEQENYAYFGWRTESKHQHCFVGQARHVGPVTGVAEKDAIAYRHVLVVPGAGLWSCSE